LKRESFLPYAGIYFGFESFYLVSFMGWPSFGYVELAQIANRILDRWQIKF